MIFVSFCEKPERDCSFVFLTSNKNSLVIIGSLPNWLPNFLNKSPILFLLLSSSFFLSSSFPLSYPYRALSSTFALSMMEIERNLFAILPSPHFTRQEFNFLSAICSYDESLCKTREFVLRHIKIITYETRIIYNNLYKMEIDQYAIVV